MGLFDSILEETPSTTTSSGSQGSGSSTSGDDTSFLIIDDSNTISAEVKGESESITPIVSEDIPNSAISFFDETPAIDNSSLNISSDDIILDLDSTATSEGVIESEPETKEEVIESVEVPKAETESFLSFETTQAQDIKEEVIESVEVPKADPNAILIEAIANLQKLLKGHEDIIESKMNIVGSKQEQITLLKQDIKALTEESKVIGEEKDKVIKMIDLFQSQKI